MRKALGTEKLNRIYGNIAKRYDFQHALITARADQKGRRILVENCVKAGDEVLDCGSGTGTTGITAARKVVQRGKVTLFDLSEDMLSVAREKSFERTCRKELPFKQGIWFICHSTTIALTWCFQRIACVPCMIR